VQCILQRGGGAAATQVQLIAAGYATTRAGLAWPYPRYQNPVEGAGRLRIITGTDPAPGNEILEAVPTGVRWRLLGIQALMYTSVTVATRYVTLQFADGSGTVWFRGADLLAQTVTQWGVYNWAIGVPARVGVLAGLVQDALPDGITLPAGWRWQTNTGNMQPGDNWYAPVYYVEEWVEP